jgi:hypothetical protein
LTTLISLYGLNNFIVKLKKQEYMDMHPVVIDSEVDDILNKVLFEVLKYSFKKEIG